MGGKGLAMRESMYCNMGRGGRKGGIGERWAGDEGGKPWGQMLHETNLWCSASSHGGWSEVDGEMRRGGWWGQGFQSGQGRRQGKENKGLDEEMGKRLGQLTQTSSNPFAPSAIPNPFQC